MPTVMERFQTTLTKHRKSKLGDYDNLVNELASGKTIAPDDIDRVRRDSDKTEVDLSSDVNRKQQELATLKRCLPAAKALEERHEVFTREYAILESRCQAVAKQAREAERALREQVAALYDALGESRAAVSELWTLAPTDIQAKYDALVAAGQQVKANEIRNTWFNKKR